MSGPSEYIAKLRGLPWSSTVDQVIEFFSKSNISNGKDGVHMTFTYEGRPSGEAFVEFVTESDLQTALERNNDFMGNRYIEVTVSSQTEMNDRLSRTGLSDKNSNDGVVRLRGLPFSATEDDILAFFKGLEIMPNGIALMTDFSGKKTGEAYVQFVGEDSTELALQKHRERIGHRYIEIFRSTVHEFTSATNNSGPGRRMMGFGTTRLSPYDRPDRYNQMNNFNYNVGNGTNKYNNPTNDWGGAGGGGNGISSYANSAMNNTGFLVHMRGLPFKATQFDICDFFKPTKPTKVHLIMDRNGRASGEADVEFETFEDAQRAMLKDRGTIQHRYIELFFDRNGYNNSAGVTMPMDMTQGMGIGNCMGTGMTMGMGMDSGMGMGRNMGMGVDSNMGMNVESTMNMGIGGMDSGMGMGMNHRMGVNVRNMGGGGPGMGIGNGMSSRMGSNVGFNMNGTGMIGNNRRMGW